MRRLVLLSLAFTLLAAPMRAQEKPFKRVLVLTGGGFRFIYQFGVYDALLDQGWKPDLVIATCGAGVVAAILHGLPDRNERVAFLQSPEMLSAFRSFRLTGGGFRSMERMIRKMSHYRTGWETGSDVIPDLFKLALYDDDPIPLPFWQKSFTDRRPEDPHFLIIGAAVDFTPADAETSRKGRKVYHEAYLTDPEVAQFLTDFPSPIGQAYPESAVSLDTRVFTDFSIGDAAIISVRDPFLLRPKRHGQQYFTGGNIDLYPLELAKYLGEEVIMTFTGGFDKFESLSINVSLGYDMNERLRSVTSNPVTRWIDATRMGNKDFTMYPELKTGFPKLFELRDNYPQDQSLLRTDGDGRSLGGHYVVTADMEWMRRALVGYDRGYDRGTEGWLSDGGTRQIRSKRKTESLTKAKAKN